MMRPVKYAATLLDAAYKLVLLAIDDRNRWPFGELTQMPTPAMSQSTGLSALDSAAISNIIAVGVEAD